MMLVPIFGALGWLMVQFDWPRPPMLLGLDLGTIAERNLWISIKGYGAAWLARPGVLIIGLLAVGAILYSIYQLRRERSQEPQGVPESAVEMQTVMIRSPVYRPLFALLWVGILAYVLREAWFSIRLEDERAAIFPLAIGIPSLALALLAFGQDLLRSIRQGASHPGLSEIASPVEPAVARRRAVAIIGWIVGFYLAIWLLGFNIAVPVATFLYLKVGARERWPITVVLTVVGWVFFYALFDYILHLPFPKGELFLWLK